MGSLKERLERIKAGFVASAPAEAVAAIDRSTEELRASGMLARLPAPGSLLPPFELTDSEGALVRSDDLLASGPLVVAFYRGVW